MNAQRFVTPILALSLICCPAFASLVDESTVDFDALATTTTLKATHLIVGEVIEVSFVFEKERGNATTGLLSIVKVRVVSDMKKTIEDAEAVAAAENVDGESDGDDASEQFVFFTQRGGPYEAGGMVEAVGFPLLEVGDYVFLRLSPRTWVITHNGVTVESCIEMFGTVYEIDKNDSDDITDHIIVKSWKDLDLSVNDMTRIVRATLKRPDEMKRFERDSNAPTKEVLMSRVGAIETALNLPQLELQ